MVNCVYIFSFLVRFKFPCAVVTEFGKYLHTISNVNHGHDWKNLFSMSSIHVGVTGLNAIECRNFISYGRDGA